MAVSMPGRTGARWRPGLLLAAPHRLGFFAAGLMMATLAAWWAAIMVGEALGIAPRWAVARPAAHAIAMTAGFMPLFFAGFLFTAVPKWLALPPVPARRLLAPVVLIVTGWPCALLGFHHSPTLAAFGVVLAALGWSVICLRFSALVRAGRVRDRLHPRLIARAGWLGALLLWLAAVAIAMDEGPLLRALALAALWGFITPVFVIATHRLMPFLGAEPPVIPARWPDVALWAVLVLLGVETMLALAEGFAATWPESMAGLMASLMATPSADPAPGLSAAAWPALRGASEAVVALLLLVLAGYWLRHQGLRHRLTTMLLVSFGWLGMAIALLAATRACQAGGAFAWGVAFETAALHALTLGHFGGMLFAMVTRIAAGQSGRRISGDVLAWRLWLLVQFAALMRVAGALWPAGAVVLLPLAALAWLAASGGWALRHGNWFGRPRVDGRPG